MKSKNFKLAFTTLGCLEWDLKRIVSKAVEYGYDGVDFRGYLSELEVYKMPEFSGGAEKTAGMFREAGLEIPCFSSSVRAFSKTDEERGQSLKEVEAYAKLCRIFKSPFIRIFPGKIGDAPQEEAIQIASENVEKMAEVAAEYDASILVETHDDWVETEFLKRLMEKIKAGNAGVVWDVHHPYRYAGESPMFTWKNIGKWVRYTHIKDSIVGNGEKKCRHTLLRKGDVPLREILSCLKEGGYKGYLTLEWEKKWVPELEAPEIAFPQYVAEMRKLLSSL